MPIHLPIYIPTPTPLCPQQPCPAQPYQLLVLFIFSFWITSIQYPSGSRMKATFFIRPSVRRFFQLTFSSSKRLQAASRSSTETPRDYRQLLYPLIFGDGFEAQEGEDAGLQMCPKPCGSAFPSWYLKASSFSTG